MPEIPEEAVQAATPDELVEAFKNTPVRFWVCINNRQHRTVTWVDDVATCDTCGLTSEMTDRWKQLVREHAAERIAGLIMTTPKPAEASWRVWAARIAREAFPPVQPNDMASRTETPQ